MSDETRPNWVGQRAVAWVIDDAPVPADLAWTLVVIARRCDDGGRGSRQSVATIAAKTGKSVKQAQRDVVRLRELGLLLLGDQSLVAHLPAGQRPTVYDVPLGLKGPKPAKESRNKSGGKKPDEPTPRMDATPPMDGTPPLDGGSTPPLDAPRTPPLDGGQKKPLNNPSEQPSSPLPPVDTSEPSRSSNQEEGDGEDSDQEERTSNLVDTIRKLRPHWSKKKITEAIATSLDDGRPLDLIERVFPHLAADPETKSPGRLPKDGPWWNIDQQERTSQRPPWCGQCDQHARQVQVESQYGEGITFARCPRCHPMNAKRVNGEYGRHTEGWQRRREQSTAEQRAAQALAVAAELDNAPIYHPDNPRRLINSHANQDRYDETL